MKEKRFFKSILSLGIVGMCIIGSKAYASTITNYTFQTQEVNNTTERFINMGTNYYNIPSPVYDFFDETGAYNVVYTSDTNVYWSTFNDNMEIVKTRTMPIIYDKSNSKDSIKELITNFGNAIYYNEHLFVIYGREHYTAKISPGSTPEETQEIISRFFEYPTMAVVKYDKNGNEVARNEMSGIELNYYTDWSDGTYLPFFPNSGCSLAINDEGILACLFGKTQFESHQLSTLFFMDTEDLRWVSNRYHASDEDKAKYLRPTEYYNGHSMFTRIIATEDGGFLFADSGDASKRGLNIGKVYKDDELNFDLKTFRALHYREGSAGTRGYNNTYSTPGNLIEVSDGYLFIGSLEKTLSRALGEDINEPWNVYAQKYKKNIQDETQISEVQMFNDEPLRTPVDEPPTDETILQYSRLYLTGNEVDYGIKWLTDLDNSFVINIKAVKDDTEKENIVLLWEEITLSTNALGRYTYSKRDSKNYYMIIDKDANILQDRTEIENAVLTTEENYVYKNNKIYWTSTNGYSREIKVNVLDLTEDLYYIEHPDEKPKFEKGDVNNDKYINSTDAALILDCFKNNSATLNDFKYGDMNSDNQLNASDAAMILDIFKSR